ncbi:MAG: hypothetical protein ABR860_14130 [Terracidiphilus sp.]
MVVEVELVVELVLPVPPVPPELSVGLPVGPGLVGPALGVLLVVLPPKIELMPPGNTGPPGPLPLRPLPPLGPIPAIDVAPPASGWPKKPMATGVLFWPKRTGFQSALLVMGSTYFLRRKRISLVLTRASALGG